MLHRALSFGLLLVASLTACSGADTQDVLAQGTSTSVPGSTGTTPGSTTPPGTTGTTPGTNPPPPQNCTQEEQEPNDTENQANQMNGTICGALSKNDQRDFVKFRLKNNTQHMSINFRGNVKLHVTVDGGKASDLTPGGTANIDFVARGNYVIEVTPLGDVGAGIDWQITIVES